MDIKVGNYHIRSDRFCCWVDKVYTKSSKAKNPGEDTIRVAGYSRNIEDLLEDFTERKSRGNDAKTVKEYLTEMATVEREIKKMIKEIQKGGDCK